MILIPKSFRRFVGVPKTPCSQNIQPVLLTCDQRLQQESPRSCLRETDVGDSTQLGNIRKLVTVIWLFATHASKQTVILAYYQSVLLR